VIDLIIKRTSLLFTFHPLFCRFNEFKQMINLGFGPGLTKPPTDLFGEIAVNIRHDVERLPPAIDHLEAWLPVSFAGSAVLEENRPTQPGTAPLSSVVLVAHFYSDF
jgi:hypothetical protein